MKKFKKILIGILFLVVLFVLGTYAYHSIQTRKEVALLKEAGYYNPVSVGDYSLNVASFGKEDGKHTIVGLAGLDMGDYAVAARQMTACLEEENRVVFVDRAGYGFSGDTKEDMTLERIVEDYRKALQNAGIEAPYILMPHSIGGAYANYWVSKYPEEIEGIVFVDGSQLSVETLAQEQTYNVSIGDRFMAVLAKLGFSRFVLRDYFYHYPDNYTDEEQKLGDALTLMTLDSIAPESEAGLMGDNALKAFEGIVANEVPKLYICASWGLETYEDIIAVNKWINRQIEINDLKLPKRALEYDEETAQKILTEYQKAREDVIYPYAEKMGNCQVVCLAGDHMIYEQKPKECGEMIKEFLRGLE